MSDQFMMDSDLMLLVTALKNKNSSMIMEIVVNVRNYNSAKNGSKKIFTHQLKSSSMRTMKIKLVKSTEFSNTMKYLAFPLFYSSTAYHTSTSLFHKSPSIAFVWSICYFTLQHLDVILTGIIHTASTVKTINYKKKTGN